MEKVTIDKPETMKWIDEKLKWAFILFFEIIYYFSLEPIYFQFYESLSFLLSFDYI